MPESARGVYTNPKQDLLDLARRGLKFEVDPLEQKSELPMRKSAVLILFGKFDDVLAEHEDMSGAKLVPDDLDVLLIRRADRSTHHPGQIAFPGGGIDPEDSGPIAAALREANEETGLNPSDVEVLGALPEVPLAVSNNVVTPVLGWWKQQTGVLAADHSEAVDVFRAPVAELLDPASRYTGFITRPPHTYYSKAFQLSERLGGHVVWGFTGILLATLFDELGWSVPWDEDRQISVI